MHAVISLIIADEDLVNTIAKDWYRQVAKAFDTTPSRVDRAIQHAKETALERSNPDTLQKLLGDTVRAGAQKLGNREVILAVANYVRHQTDD